jgi:hypothetical protein
LGIFVVHLTALLSVPELPEPLTVCLDHSHNFRQAGGSCYHNIWCIFYLGDTIVFSINSETYQRWKNLFPQDIVFSLDIDHNKLYKEFNFLKKELLMRVIPWLKTEK